MLNRNKQHKDKENKNSFTAKYKVDKLVWYETFNNIGDTITREKQIKAGSRKKKILLIRGLKVMLDRDLAELYGVETRVLNQAVKRNKSRFPNDFMFQLTRMEAEFLASEGYLGGVLRSQIVTLKKENASNK